MTVAKQRENKTMKDNKMKRQGEKRGATLAWHGLPKGQCMLHTMRIDCSSLAGMLSVIDLPRYNEPFGASFS